MMRIGVLMAVVVAVLVSLAPPAQAELWSATAACRSNDRSGTYSTASFTLPGTTEWREVHELAALGTGDVFRITATGRVHHDGGSWFGKLWGPDGAVPPEPAPDGWWTAVGENKFSVVGMWGRNGHTFGVGSDSGCLDYTTDYGTGSDTLYVGYNDSGHENNFGSFEVRVDVWRNPNEVVDWGFEDQRLRVISAPWAGEGTGGKGMDVRRNFQHTGHNNGFIRTATPGWNAIKQEVPVSRFTWYRMQVWVETSGNFQGGFFGVRHGTTSTVLADQRYGEFARTGYERKTLEFHTGTNRSVTVFVGFWCPGYDSFVRMDDIAIWPIA